MSSKLIVVTLFKCLFVIFYGVIGCFGMLLELITHGPRKFFHRKQRHSRPECMNDPALGEHGFLSLNKADIRIHYVAAGDEDKPLMLLVHGFPECWYIWRHQLRAFKNDYRVVAIDLRGYGESETPNGVLNYTSKIIIDDIKEVVLELGYNSCVLVAHDWGGVIAWRVAMEYPELVDKLVVANAAYPERMKQHLMSHLSQFRKSWFMFFFQIPYLSEMMIQANDYGFIEDCFYGKSRTPADMCTQDDMEAMKYAFSQKGNVTAALNYYRASSKTKPMKSKNVSSPTLLIWGEKDDVLEVEMAKGTEKYVENMRLEVIEDAGHFIIQDNPVEVNRLINEFLKGQQ
ncbi:epoxide hydrolase 4-like [Antedon mediterranea]|uniref:epoxide hydrolase 4-like n=1 Tax=Antedon mediterranea TaxID=105859 RepID=UPI003AF82D8C